MRFIPTRIHGIVDYVVGLLLIAAPWLLGFAEGGVETWLPVVLGVATILYSVITDYELGAVPVLNMRTHLLIDGIAGAFLLISPWLLGYSDIVWVPHFLVGLLEVGAALTTHLSPEQGARRTAGGAATG